ncbi:uncharacterized protein FFFS_16006 [Fusarium fujikuroi]|jgi:hypothetical protein
MPYD